MKIVTPCVLCRKNIPQGKRKVSIQATGLIGLVCHNCYMALGKSHRLVRLYSHIASLTAEVERLREHIKALNALVENHVRKEMLQTASLTAENQRLRVLLIRWSEYSEMDRIMGGVEAYETLVADTDAALQPKEGNP